MARAGKQPTAGQEIRLADIEADAGQGLGLFDALHIDGTPAAQAFAIKEARTRWHGAVGVEWLPRLVTDRATVADRVAAFGQQFCADVLPAEAVGQVTRVARRFALDQVLGCSGAARVDFRITPKGKPFVLEINTVPGMTETSLLPMAAGKAGLSYDALTERILQSALGRAGVGLFRAVR